MGKQDTFALLGQDSQIGGYEVRAGTNVLFNAFAVMHDPDTWENQDEFRPKRFLYKDGFGMGLKKRQDMSYFPFGSRRRACIGEAHAYNIMHAAICPLVQCVDGRMDDTRQKSNIKVATAYSRAMANTLVCSPIGRLNPMLSSGN